MNKLPKFLTGEYWIESIEDGLYFQEYWELCKYGVGEK
jgi:hypothetical protein